MDLLLQVDNIFICCIFVWISTENTRLRCALFLTSELHLVHGVVASTVSESSKAVRISVEVCTLADTAST